MRTVKARRWRDLAGSADVKQVHPAYRGYAYFARRRSINKVSFLFSIIVVSALVGLEHRAALVLFVGLSSFTAYLYLRARAQADGLCLKRSAPAKAVERDEIEVGWELVNRGAFAVRDVLLIDSFAGSVASRQVVWVDAKVAAFGSVSGVYRTRCDAGMGVFDFAPLTAVVSDPLGVFEFVVTEDRPSIVEVYPKLEPIPQIRVPGSKESFLYGIYDLPTRGASVNFSGIRDFARGDPLKHIAWRLSKRHGRLLVKQFEKIANTEISVLLNMDARDHAGRKSESTWEYAKDAALAIVSQQMSHGNSIQLLSNRKTVAWGRGEAHANLIAKVVFGLLPEPEPRLEAAGAGAVPIGGVAAGGSRTLVDRFYELIPDGSTAVFIGPLLESDPDVFLRSLLKLRLKDVNVICVLVRAAGFLEGKVQGEARPYVETSAWKNQAQLDRLVGRIRAEGMTAYLLDCGQEIGRSFL